MAMAEYVVWLKELGSADVARVGGKNASPGGIIRTLKGDGVRVPDGFATTATAYRDYLAATAIEPELRARLEALNASNTSLHGVGTAIRRLFLEGEFPAPLAGAIRDAYAELCRRGGGEDNIAVAPAAGDAVARADDATELLRIDVDELTRVRALVADDRHLGEHQDLWGGW